MVAAACWWPATGTSQAVANPGFEQATIAGRVLRPAAWELYGDGYELTLDSAERVDGGTSLRSRRVGPSAPVPRVRGSRVSSAATQRVPAGRALGRSVRLTGWIRTQDVRQGFAGLWVRVDSAGRGLALDNMSDRGPQGTTPWTHYVVEVPVDSAATTISFGVVHQGAGIAWFDSLALDVGGPTLARRATTAAYVPPVRPFDPRDRLLTDDELARPTDGARATLDRATVAWMHANARPIRSLTATDSADLAFLGPLLAGRRIVQLGETSHGTREFSLAKVRLIKYLHQALGYDVIAFESPLFACEHAGRSAASLAPVELLRACVHPVWHTAEVLLLLDYVRDTQGTARPLTLTGFDVQVGAGADTARAAFLRDAVAPLDRAYAQRVFATDSAFHVATRGAGAAYHAYEQRERLVAFYDSLAAWLRAHEARLAAFSPERPTTPALARQTAASMAVWVRQLAADGAGGGAYEQAAIRDRGMADNLDAILAELHPGKKVIVWAHNFHVRHRRYAPGVTPDDELPDRVPRTMGTYVAERHRPTVYTVGLYMYRGSVVEAGRTHPVAPAAPGSLEAILHHAPWRYTFLDLAHATPDGSARWMVERVSALAGGRIREPLVPRDEYDAIVFIDTTWPPTYGVATRPTRRR